MFVLDSLEELTGVTRPVVVNIAVTIGILLAVFYFVPVVFGRRRLPYPPGPPAEFLLGHLRVIPKEDTAQTYAQWSKQYSPSSPVPVRALYFLN